MASTLSLPASSTTCSQLESICLRTLGAPRDAVSLSRHQSRRRSCAIVCKAKPEASKAGRPAKASRGDQVKVQASSSAQAMEKEKEAKAEGLPLTEPEPEPEPEEESKKSKKGKKGKERKIRFIKYQGLGNDFIMVDNRKQSEPLVTAEEAVGVCNRNFGVGGDGIIFLLPAKKGTQAQYAMRIFNSDGSEPEMCGNGIRCLARFLAEVEEDKGAQRYVVSTLAGNMVLNLREDGQVQVDMGEPILAAAQVPTTLAPTTDAGAVVQAPLDVAGDTWHVTCVSMGNPHCVVFSSANNPEGLDVAALDLHALGPQFENNPVFPARINTEFVQVISRTEVRMRVWERGAGPTLACGTGACALVVAAVLEGRTDRRCLVHLPGGPLEIEWRAEDNRIYMTGPAEEVFSGKFLLPASSA